MGFFGNITPHWFYSLVPEIKFMKAIALLPSSSFQGFVAGYKA